MKVEPTDEPAATSVEPRRVLVVASGTVPLDELVAALDDEYGVRSTVVEGVEGGFDDLDGVDCAIVGPGLGEDGITAIERVQGTRPNLPVVFPGPVRSP